MNELDDPLEELFGGAKSPTPRPMARPLPEAVMASVFVENCMKCHGTGRFRHLGPCFACKGKGKFEFKSSPEARAKARLGAAKRAIAKEKAAWDGFVAAHAAEAAWILANPSFEFAVSMRSAVEKYGDLTANQLAAVQRCILRQEQRTAEREQRKAAAPVVEAAKLEEAFAHARQAAAKDREGIKWLRLYLDTFKFSDAPARGDYAACIFVNEGDVKLGRISGGKFHRSFHCDDATQQRVLAAIADPAAAAKAYGQRTGSCSVCGRELTNKKSRELGIGPICAERYGW